MKEHPILFSGEMVRAILDGRKTMTRRVVKPQPLFEARDARECPENVAFALPTEYVVDGDHTIMCPYGKPGDRLWVRETWYYNGCGNCPVHYRATEPDYDGYEYRQSGWNPSIFMPRVFSRILLEVVSVRIERIQDITFIGAIYEGSYLDRCSCLPRKNDSTPIEKLFRQTSCHIHGQEFQQLWNSINAKRGYGWDANPWVWVVEFKRVEMTID